MKIEFTGAGGTGKTTTALMVAEALGLELLPSIAPTMRKHTVIFEEHLKQIEKYKGQSYVADQSLIYLLAQALLNSKEETLTNPDLAFMWEATKHAASRVDIMVYFPLPHWDVDDDKFRLMSVPASVALDNLTVGILQTMQIPSMKAFQGKAKDRVLQITTAARLMNVTQRQKPVVETIRNPIKLG